jgi:DnaK suppressor protein
MAELEQRLRAARRVLLQTVSATDVELKTLEEREVGAPIEDAAREEGLGILARLEDRELEELREITAALRRIAQGQYGVCEGCGARIPVERLRARPAARLCVPCQSRWEGPSGGGARGSGGRAP